MKSTPITAQSHCPPARTKNRRTHVIHLSPAAAAILKSPAQANGREFVFGIGLGGFSGWSKSKERLDARVKLAPWVIHDLRRAMATHMGEIGVLPHVVEGCLNHVSGTKGGIAGRYNKAQYEGWKAEAWVRWAEHLMAPLRAAKAKSRHCGRRDMDEKQSIEELKKRAEKLKRAIAQGERLRAENQKQKADNLRREDEFLKKQRGGPKWKSELGYHLICAINALTADGTSVLKACTELHDWSDYWRFSARPRMTRQKRHILEQGGWDQFRQRVGEHWSALSDHDPASAPSSLSDECWDHKPRQLQSRYHDALKYWRGYFERERALDAEMESFRAICDAAMAPPDATEKKPK